MDSNALVEEVDALAPPTEITSPEQYRAACEQLGGVQALRRKVDAHYDELKAPVLVAQRGVDQSQEGGARPHRARREDAHIAHRVVGGRDGATERERDPPDHGG